MVIAAHPASFRATRIALIAPSYPLSRSWHLQVGSIAMTAAVVSSTTRIERPLRRPQT